MVKRVEEINKQLDTNINTLDKVQKLTIKVNAENFHKKIIEIPILSNYTVAAYDSGGGGGGGLGG